MCELSVYLMDSGAAKLVMDGVVRLVDSEGRIVMESILGEAKEIPGRLAEVDVTSGKALVVPIKA
jgi:predicted RNA-binding protein